MKCWTAKTYSRLLASTSGGAFALPALQLVTTVKEGGTAYIGWSFGAYPFGLFDFCHLHLAELTLLHVKSFTFYTVYT